MTVSVIIPAYNAAAVIRRAIDSVFAQSTPAHEIIVIDDASTDDTRQIVERLSGGPTPIRLIALDRNIGPSAARNAGFDQASGDWVALLDADDAWKPRRLERLLEVVAGGDCDFVADNLILYDEVGGAEVRPAFTADWESRAISIEDHFRSDITSLSSFSYGLLKPIMRVEALRARNLRYDETMRYAEDFLFYAELLLNGIRAIVIREAFYVYSSRIGEFSGKLNPHSQSQPRFDLIVAATDALVQRHGERLSPDVRKLIAIRRREKSLVHQANVARDFRRDRDYAGYLAYVLKRPALVAALARELPRHAARLWRRR